MIYNLRNVFTNEVTTISEASGDVLSQYTNTGWTVEEYLPEDEEEIAFLANTSEYSQVRHYSQVDWTDMNNNFLL